MQWPRSIYQSPFRLSEIKNVRNALHWECPGSSAFLSSGRAALHPGACAPMAFVLRYLRCGGHGFFSPLFRRVLLGVKLVESAVPSRTPFRTRGVLLFFGFLALVRKKGCPPGGVPLCPSTQFARDF